MKVMLTRISYLMGKPLFLGEVLEGSSLYSNSWINDLYEEKFGTIAYEDFINLMIISWYDDIKDESDRLIALAENAAKFQEKQQSLDIKDIPRPPPQAPKKELCIALVREIIKYASFYEIAQSNYKNGNPGYDLIAELEELISQLKDCEDD